MLPAVEVVNIGYVDYDASSDGPDEGPFAGWLHDHNINKIRRFTTRDVSIVMELIALRTNFNGCSYAAFDRLGLEILDRSLSELLLEEDNPSRITSSKIIELLKSHGLYDANFGRASLETKEGRDKLRSEVDAVALAILGEESASRICKPEISEADKEKLLGFPNDRSKLTAFILDVWHDFYAHRPASVVIHYFDDMVCGPEGLLEPLSSFLRRNSEWIPFGVTVKFYEKTTGSLPVERPDLTVVGTGAYKSLPEIRNFMRAELDAARARHPDPNHKLYLVQDEKQLIHSNRQQHVFECASDPNALKIKLGYFGESYLHAQRKKDRREIFISMQHDLCRLDIEFEEKLKKLNKKYVSEASQSLKDAYISLALAVLKKEIKKKLRESGLTPKDRYEAWKHMWDIVIHAEHAVVHKRASDSSVFFRMPCGTETSERFSRCQKIIRKQLAKAGCAMPEHELLSDRRVEDLVLSERYDRMRTVLFWGAATILTAGAALPFVFMAMIYRAIVHSTVSAEARFVRKLNKISMSSEAEAKSAGAVEPPTA